MAQGGSFDGNSYEEWCHAWHQLASVSKFSWRYAGDGGNKREATNSQVGVCSGDPTFDYSTPGVL